MKNAIFCFLTTLHIFVWAFIMTAFVNFKCAYVNFMYVIPFMYLMHILPFHLLVELKKNIYDDQESRTGRAVNSIPIVSQFHKLMNITQKFSTFNPLSPQGMMIFGALTSGRRLVMHYR